MSLELFEDEEQIIESSRAILASNTLNDAAREPFAALLKSFEKLFKTTRRMMRLSDRNEHNLMEVSKSLDEKNAMLERLSHQLSKYLSPQVYATIFSGQRQVTLNTERKKLTVFFSDIKDFTATTDDMEPEDLTFLINDYLTEMTRIALKYGATIDKYIGDAILIFFGDPESRGVQEDAQACVRMALEMQRHMADLRTKWSEMGYARPFHMRVGINTGYCNVGNFGSNERMDYTIIGGEVNLAARLEGVSDADGITLSYETYALVKDLVVVERGEPLTVKGIHRQITPYKVVDILADVENSGRFFRQEKDGMRLFLDFDRLTEQSRRLEAIETMKRALERLNCRVDGGEIPSP
ncbi:MAG: adenylate/guanylate cyclase domain-containing protein [Magnetococcales bacterium]|nr:adenylate/guanylate cyclase domain-containing protein [Magnetococcales bacterium]